MALSRIDRPWLALIQANRAHAGRVGRCQCETSMPWTHATGQAPSCSESMSAVNRRMSPSDASMASAISVCVYP